MELSRENMLAALVGGPEALASLVSGAATFPAATIAGGLRMPYGRLRGESAGEASKAGGEMFKRFMEAGTYVPRSGAGREAMDLVGQGLEKSKIPAYSPIGRMRVPNLNETAVGTAKALEKPILAATEQAPGIPRGAMAAIKPGPGGHWTPSSQQRLAALLTPTGGEAGLDFTGPQHVKDWAEKVSTRWLSKHLGTDKDPSRGLNLGTAGDPVTLEQLVDKSLRKRTLEGLPAEERPVNARPGEDVWSFNPRPQLASFLSHAGDFAQNLPAQDLARTDIPTLLRMVHEADRRQLTTTGKRLGAREEAAQRITAEHPGGAYISDPQASWYKFEKGMDPEAVKKGLSVDTCIGEHCIAEVAHNKPQWGYPFTNVPVRDLVSGKPMRELHPEAQIPDTTSYIEKVLRGEAKAYSLRDPQGQPLGTSFVGSRVPAGVLRNDMRFKIMTPKEYNAWQTEQRVGGSAVEQRVQLPAETRDFQGVQVPVGRGHIVPKRPTLGPEELASIVAKYPHYKVAIDALAVRRMNQMEQMKGRKNLGVPPEYSARLAALLNDPGVDLNKPNIASSSAQLDLMHSGVGVTKKGGVFTIQDLLAAHNAQPAPQGGWPRPYTAGMGDLLSQRGLKGLTREQARDLGEAVRHLMEARREPE